MAELLLELFSEEIPAGMQARAADDLKRLVGDGLKEAQLAFEHAEAFATPRRLVLVVGGLPTAQPDITVERKGPRVGAPEKAIAGFLRSAGLASIDQCEVRDAGKGEVYFAIEHRKGRPTADVLAEILPAAIAALPWPKSMRWGGNAVRWVRPLHRILCLFDGAVVPCAFGPVTSGDTTAGHRFLAPQAFAVKDFADYRDKLRAAYVMLDGAERRAVIEKEAALRAEAEGLAVKPDAALVTENAGLAEWPVVLMGQIDPDFMDIPPEVLTTSMRSHQKYFSLRDKDGKLAPRFLLVANMIAGDGGKQIVAGNERVLRARLADAKFFWDQDRKRSLASRAPALKEIVFHAKLGTLDEKIDRVQELAVEIAAHVPGADKDRVHAAARLAKADLTTGMVGEFPELQGIMGRYYALHDGAHAEVADAIAEHYSPLGPNDACPSAPVSVAVALADKIDTLFWFFAIGQLPTGSKDPFALRRAALGIIRLIIENGLRICLGNIFDVARKLGNGELARFGTHDRSRRTQEVIDALLEFFADRLKVHLREKGVRHDLISAVFAAGHDDDLVRLLSRVDALETFLRSDDGANLLVAYRRAANIVRIEETKDKARYKGEEMRIDQFVQTEEQELGEYILEAESGAQEVLPLEDFTGAMAAMAKLRRPVDRFFDCVTVNADDADLRVNRLRLLSRIGETLNHVADFSKIEG